RDPVELEGRALEGDGRREELGDRGDVRPALVTGGGEQRDRRSGGQGARSKSGVAFGRGRTASGRAAVPGVAGSLGILTHPGARPVRAAALRNAALGGPPGT